jgi:hypothetical protein
MRYDSTAVSKFPTLLAQVRHPPVWLNGDAATVNNASSPRNISRGSSCAANPTASADGAPIITARRLPWTRNIGKGVETVLRRSRHPDYWRRYREQHPATVERNRQQQHVRDQNRQKCCSFKTALTGDEPGTKPGESESPSGCGLSAKTAQNPKAGIPARAPGNNDAIDPTSRSGSRQPGGAGHHGDTAPAAVDPTLPAPTLTPAPSVACGPASGNPMVAAVVTSPPVVPAKRVSRRRSTKKLRRSHWESAPIEELAAYVCS